MDDFVLLKINWFNEFQQYQTAFVELTFTLIVLYIALSRSFCTYGGCFDTCNDI